MGHGGARTRSGPPPDPNALRRSRDGKDWVKLRPEGRGDKPVPDWPLLPDAGEQAEVEYLEGKAAELQEDYLAAADAKVARGIAGKLDRANRELAIIRARVAARERQEMEFWARLWRLPQAVVWEADAGEIQVAMYVRVLVDAQRPGGATADRTLAARLAGELLLTTPSLHAMRYVIDRGIAGATAADLTGEQGAKIEKPEPTPAPPMGGARSRFTVVRDDTDEESA